MSVKLSRNFTLEELTRTDTDLPNEPSPAQLANLAILAGEVLQPIRDRWGRIKINSGYRSLGVNRAVGGSATTQHVRGEAADIVPLDASIEEAFSWIVGNLTFGQAILAKKTRPDGTVARWIHISLARLDKPNQIALLFRDGKYTEYRKEAIG